MVDVSSQNNSVSINVSSGGNSASIKATPDMAQYYSEKSREWAISNRIVDNTDYSSKYYAEKSKESEAKAENYERSVIEKYNSFVEVSNQAETELQTLRDDSILQINTVASSGISDIANKTSEAVTEINLNKEVATNEINNAKNNAVTQLSKEAQEQLKNIESTGFYMRDDKLYFINSEGEEEEFKTNGNELNNPFILLESKYFESEIYNVSWLLANGSYNGSNAVHPSAYQALLVENNAEVAIGSTVTLPIGTEYTKRGLSVKLSTDSDITDYDFVVNASDETFRLPIKVNLASGKAVVGNGQKIIWQDTTDETEFPVSVGYSQAVMNNVWASQGIDAVDVGLTTDPTKSGIETSDSNLYLYFYVGETVQNANLVNVGRIEEKLSDCLTRNNKEEIVSWGMPDFSSGIAKDSSRINQAETDGWIYIASRQTNNATASGNLVYSTDGVNFDTNAPITYVYLNGSYDVTFSNLVPISKGIYYKTSKTTVSKYVFYPCKGVK